PAVSQLREQMVIHNRLRLLLPRRKHSSGPSLRQWTQGKVGEQFEEQLGNENSINVPRIPSSDAIKKPPPIIGDGSSHPNEFYLAALALVESHLFAHREGPNPFGWVNEPGHQSTNAANISFPEGEMQDFIRVGREEARRLEGDADRAGPICGRFLHRRILTP